MYLGPLRMPPAWVWVAAVAACGAIALLALLGLNAVVVTIVVIVVVLAIAAPRRVRDLGADEMRDSRPDE